MFIFDPFWRPQNWFLGLDYDNLEYLIYYIVTSIVVNFGISGAVVLERRKINTHPLVSLFI